MTPLLRFFPVLLLATASISVLAQRPETIPGDIIIQVAPGADAQAIAEAAARFNGEPTGLHVVRELSRPMRAWLLHYEAIGIDHSAFVRQVRSQPGVTIAQSNHVVKDRIVPNDPQYGSVWHHDNIDSEIAWDISTGGLTATGDTIVVCIVENADLPHPDLIGNAWFNFQEIPNNGTDDDANGFVDDFQGWNPSGNDDDVYGGGHGTQVAGMIGAKGDNGLGIAGANWDVKMMVVTRSGISEAAVIESYTYPLEMRKLYNTTGGNKGAFVVATNSSWGIDNADPNDYPLWCAFYDSLGAAGVLSCGATANNNLDMDVVGDMPTGCTSDFMVSVTATNDADVRTFSGYGATVVDVGAPGEDVYTTSIGGGYGSTSGTSFASPLTAGVIGLLYSAPCSSMMNLVQSDPAAGALFVRDALFGGVEQVGNLPGNCTTGGRINAFNSMQLILDGCGPCPAPYDLTVANVDSNTVVITWQSSASDTFNVQYRPLGFGAYIPLGQVTALGYTLSGLTGCTTYEFQVEGLCDSISSGFSTVLFTTDGCCTAPDFVTVGFVGDNSGNVTWQAVSAATSYEAQISVEGSGVWTSIPGITNAFYEFTGLDSCTTYEVTVRTICSGGPTAWSDTVSFKTSGCGACLDLPYCPSESDDASEEWIAGVQVGTLNNVTGTDDGYGDYTGLGTELEIGQGHPITLTPGFDGQLFNEYFKVFVDLDQNGDFDGTGELAYDAGAMTQTAVTGTLTIPVGALEGFTRMRVMMIFNDDGGVGCTDGYNYGETEDYCVTLVDFISGVNEQAAARVNFFPNPADRNIFFDLTGVDAANAFINVMDNTGRVVASRRMEWGRATITTAWLADGLYFYSVVNGNSELARGKFEVMH
ncbi:MAG: S8 family serine peptidase [Flavobacteriales bacterium]|nr:MAG: S8 family serine peptidase [Flavobacteriales bacterium]